MPFYENKEKGFQHKVSFTLKHKLALALVDLEASDIVLDIGGGTGILTFAVNQKKVWATDLDLAKTQLRIAKKMRIEAVLGDAQELPFKNGSVTVCFAIEILEHAPNPEKIILETHRILRKDGTLIIVVPNDPNWLIYRIISGNFYEAFRNRGHLHDFSSNSKILKILKGYKVVKVKENKRKPVIMGYMISKVVDLLLHFSQNRKQKLTEDFFMKSYGLVDFLDNVYQRILPLPKLTLHRVFKLAKC